MTAFQVPTYSGGAAAWQLADYKAVTVQSGPASGGIATATGPQVDPGTLWLIDHGVITCTSKTDTTCRLFDSQAGDAFLLDGSNTGNLDVTEYPNGLQIAQGRQLVAVWSNASDGAVGTLNLQLRLLRYAGG